MAELPARPSVTRTLALTLVLGGLLAGGAFLYSGGAARLFLHGPAGGLHQHGAGGMAHDEATMPGLRGVNATPEESADLAVLFRNFATLSRSVTNLPDGIRTVTSSSDPDVMTTLVNHVTGMIGRVETGDDPKIMIQSPTLDIFFARGPGIVTDISVTDEGIVVTQTATDPELVTALQTHAAEVSDMAARGMQAVHDAMAKRSGG